MKWLIITFHVASLPFTYFLIKSLVKDIVKLRVLTKIKKVKNINYNNYETLELQEVETNHIVPKGNMAYFTFEVHDVQIAIILKQGSRVMFITNDKEGRYANGTMDEVIRLNQHIIIVQLENGTIISVKPYDWVQRDIRGRVVAKLTQYPIRLAYAITIHKSQGMTLDKVIVDCEGIFEPGQLYTPLSRCKSKKGLIIRWIWCMGPE